MMKTDVDSRFFGVRETLAFSSFCTKGWRLKHAKRRLCGVGAMQMAENVLLTGFARRDAGGNKEVAVVVTLRTEDGP